MCKTSFFEKIWENEYSKQKEYILSTSESKISSGRRVRQDGSTKEKEDDKIYYLFNGTQKV